MDYNKHKKTGVLKVSENRIFKTNPGNDTKYENLRNTIF